MKTNSNKIYLQAFFMLLSVFLFSLNDTFNKFFVKGIRPQEIIFWRSLFETGLLLLFLHFTNRRTSYKEKCLDILNTPYLKMHIVRVSIAISSILFEIYSLKFLPLSSFAFIYAFNPLVVVLFSIIFLGERPHGRIWVTVACGATSALIMSSPGEETSFAGAPYAIIAILLYASSILLTKKCSQDRPFRTLFFYALFPIFPCLIACGGILEASAQTLLCFLGQALLHIGAFFSLITALRLGNLSFASTLEYSDILWAMLLGYLCFGEIPTPLFWLAASLLIFGKIFYFWKIKNHA